MEVNRAILSVVRLVGERREEEGGRERDEKEKEKERKETSPRNLPSSRIRPRSVVKDLESIENWII